MATTLFWIINFTEHEVYTRIHHLQQAAFGSLDKFEFCTEKQAVDALAAYKQKYPKKAKSRKKVNN